MSRSAIITALLALVFISVSASANAQQLSGFYVRGDVGGAFGNDTTFSDPGVFNGSTSGNIGSSVIFGGGIGYRFSPLFRSDVTLDYIPSFRASGRSSIGSTSSANIDSLVGMVNGYFDLNGAFPNTFGAFQPYLDAGFGFSSNSMGSTTLNAPGGPFNFSSNTNTDFAWALGAGVAYPLSQNLLIDVAYRYIDLGQAQTGTRLTGPGGSITVSPAKGSLSTNIVTAGLRYQF